MGRRNGTLRAAAALNLNPYGWGNGRGQAMAEIKKARRRQPERATKKIIQDHYNRMGGYGQ